MEAQGRGIMPLRSLTLDLPPSCIEFCPGHPDYFMIGTYNLQKGDDDPETVTEDDKEEQQTTKSAQTRDGSLVLFRLTETNNIKHIQTILYPSAILDLHFHPEREGCTVLAVVSSTGTLSFFRLSSSEGSQVSLEEIITHRPFDDDEGVLFLSCSWHPYISELLAITTSDYQVHILQIDKSWNIHKTRTEPVITHTLEAWTVAFSSLTPKRSNLDVTDSLGENLQQFTIFSGGDDSKLLATNCAYNLNRICGEDDSIETPYPITTIKGHEAGVTAILPLDMQLASLDSVVITGSYDDHIRVFAVNDQGMFLQKSRLLAEENLQGGVWRLKLISLQKSKGTADGQQWKALVLASCMHAGSRVLEITGNIITESCEIKVLGRFEEHKSMNYGSDFQPGSELGDRKLRCVSTSFYDRLLCLWEY
ncbi:hypothetical protein F4781DRAFT_395404 [Annulohypoxylon bovei var. microspora]|nr:hypothetical protein F4781DRAFT_395404 [Annulohypoxylon bovei var. microspora]